MHTKGRSLLLNATYEPLYVLGWKRVVTLLFLNKIEVLEEYPILLRSTSRAIPMPAVVRLTRMVRRTGGPKIQLSRRNVFLRDNFTCQYDRKVYRLEDLTLDHVTPKSLGGKTSWDNLVTACVDCNRRKGNRLPEQVGLALARPPRPPSPSRSITFNLGHRAVPGEWIKYLNLSRREPFLARGECA